MSPSFLIQQPGAGQATQIKELDRVALTEEVVAEGYVLPAGAKGTAVLSHGRGEAFEVECTTPYHAVVGIPSSLLRLTD